MIRLADGDEMVYTKQADNSFNVIVDLMHSDGERRIVVNVIDPDAFYVKIRDMFDNPPARDLEGEREALVYQRTMLDDQVTEIDAKIIERDEAVIVSGEL